MCAVWLVTIDNILTGCCINKMQYSRVIKIEYIILRVVIFRIYIGICVHCIGCTAVSILYYKNRSHNTDDKYEDD